MISFEEALGIVLNHAHTMGRETVNLVDSVGRVLVADVISDIDMPPFNRAAVDGFACRMDELGKEWDVIETVRAGTFPEKTLGPGQCTRIMTGAPVPEGADCVVMVEDTEELVGDRVRFTGQKTKTNISPLAEDIRMGETVIGAGTVISPQHVAIMAAVGHIAPVVARRPKVAVIATGDEIVEPHLKPGLSQIRNSNGYQLVAQVSRAGAIPIYLGIAPDNEDETLSAINHGLSQADIVLLTGGVSMGTFDFVQKILEKAGVEILFRTIALQPGKPTIFGLKGNKRIFGLPGNPVSSFTLFEVMVKPMILKMMGAEKYLEGFRLPLGQDYRRKRSDRMQWLPVEIRERQVFPLEYHGSAHIFSLANADALAAIPLGVTSLSAGEYVDVRPI